ncbi:uncharacterized protein LOC130647743 [Hydractinia symbiolongicarpus]|uniref:uncharacterized protein LOC130647743 n=1 Tax=Hydractinia symbiolongicarpus TaxID=13093 RepID=UPI00254C5D25|nr:uncharacterized protein LOC130647743 [Hydractinia symbiolongicarpus]
MKFLVVMIAVVGTVSALNSYPEERDADSSVYEEGYRNGYADAQPSEFANVFRHHHSPTKDCSASVKNCNGCRRYLSSCCVDRNCSGGRKCKRGIWSYSCDN